MILQVIEVSPLLLETRGILLKLEEETAQTFLREQSASPPKPRVTSRRDTNREREATKSRFNLFDSSIVFVLLPFLTIFRFQLLPL